MGDRKWIALTDAFTTIVARKILRWLANEKPASLRRLKSLNLVLDWCVLAYGPVVELPGAVATKRVLNTADTLMSHGGGNTPMMRTVAISGVI